MGAFAILVIIATVVFIIYMSVMIYLDLFHSPSKKKDQVEVFNTGEMSSEGGFESQPEEADDDSDNPRFISEEEYVSPSSEFSHENLHDESQQPVGESLSETSPKSDEKETGYQELVSKAGDLIHNVPVKGQTALEGIQEILLYESGEMPYRPRITYKREEL